MAAHPNHAPAEREDAEREEDLAGEGGSDRELPLGRRRVDLAGGVDGAHLEDVAAGLQAAELRGRGAGLELGLALAAGARGALAGERALEPQRRLPAAARELDLGEPRVDRGLGDLGVERAGLTASAATTAAPAGVRLGGVDQRERADVAGVVDGPDRDVTLMGREGVGLRAPDAVGRRRAGELRGAGEALGLDRGGRGGDLIVIRRAAAAVVAWRLEGELVAVYAEGAVPSRS
jgi:hypothetical protein